MASIFSPHSRPFLIRFLLYILPGAFMLIAGMGVVGIVTNRRYIDNAVERNVRLRSTVIVRSLETFLNNRIRDISLLSRTQVNQDSLLQFMQRQAAINPSMYREAGLLTGSAAESLLFVSVDGRVHQISAEHFSQFQPDPLRLPHNLHTLAKGEVFCTNVSTKEFPFPASDGVGNRQEIETFRMITPYSPAEGKNGYLLLGVDAKRLRNVLSQSSTSQGKAWGFERSKEVRFSYIFDADGWILFQSEDPEEAQKKLSTHLPRAGVHGTLGKPGMPPAFLPDRAFEDYWKMVEQVRKRQSGLSRMRNGGVHDSPMVSGYFMAYEPITYLGKAGGEPRLFSGMVYIDRSRLAFEAYKATIFTSLVWASGTVFLLLFFFFMMKKFFLQPVDALQKFISSRLDRQHSPEHFPKGTFLEMHRLIETTDRLIQSLDQREGELEKKNNELMSETMQLPEDIHEHYEKSLARDHLFPNFIGMSAEQSYLKEQIQKAAATDIDVFVSGETGTGKELVAEAVHRLSSRSNMPFVAINCGALNENLLLDTLFGHVKGAHSEAKTDRKGAFLEASGGTLFLDEIQAASHKVQQALLRAIAERRIRPLGSDVETEVDIRLITATNQDLMALVKSGAFREDLFYRLVVLTLKTTPLRFHKEDIPLLAYHYLLKTQEIVDKSGLQFSRGAIQKLVSYDWPGNVRELVNCITRTVIFAQETVIQADDLRMDGPDKEVPLGIFTLTKDRTEDLSGTEPDQLGKDIEKMEPGGRQPDARRHQEGEQPQARDSSEQTLPILSERQSRVLPLIVQKGSITRREYQEVFGGGFPARTANYDLNDLIRKGLLKKTGAGSTTRYLLNPGMDRQALDKMMQPGGQEQTQQQRGGEMN
jgi:DNA-binding NtrC family response regulator